MAESDRFILSLQVKDIRFPTSLQGDGSDAMHTDPDYSCAYVTLITNDNIESNGFTFTLGRGTEIVTCAIKSLAKFVIGVKLKDIFDDFSTFWHKLTNETQMRWIGPEKGVIHLATAAIVNALWDMWAKIEKKPLWKLLVDMEPEKLISTIDFTYITDALTKQEALKLLTVNKKTKQNREEEILASGYPAYTTNCGWLGYPTEKIQMLCKQFLELGFTRFKIKVGQDIKDDERRCQIVRDVIGWDNTLMVDANQRWDVPTAIQWMSKLAQFHPLWIEEPTSPDDILGHATIAKGLLPMGISVATGEQCHNKVMFKQFLQSGGMQFCQIDSCRLGGVNEILAVLLMAKKFNVPVCPHAGGVGLCELVQHLMFFDYVCLTGTTKNRMIEYVSHLHEHFVDPVTISNACYMAPKNPGYSTTIREECLSQYEYPTGSKWVEMFSLGIYQKPDL